MLTLDKMESDSDSLRLFKEKDGTFRAWLRDDAVSSLASTNSSKLSLSDML